MNLVDDVQKEADLDEVEMLEDQAEIELNEKEAPFLQGQTTKSHVAL